MAHTCRGCDYEWNGFRQAHCSSCHLTFSTPGNFDEHRSPVRGGSHRGPMNKCIDPETVGLIQNSFGVYRKLDERDLAEEMKEAHGR